MMSEGPSAEAGQTVDSTPVRGKPRNPLQRLTPSIRHKIILPYLLLTLIAAAMGIFIITRLIATSIDERFTNQLLETGRVASDGIVRQENRQLEASRAMTQTIGVVDATDAENVAELRRLMEVQAYNYNLDSLIVLNRNGDVIMRLDAVRNFNAEVIDDYTLDQNGNLADLNIVQPVLTGAVDAGGDKYAGLVQGDEQVLLYTVSPILRAAEGNQPGEIVGALMVGITTTRLLNHLKAESLADVVIYTEPGRPLGSTIPDWELDEQYQVLILSESIYNRVIALPEQTPISSDQQLTLFERDFRMAYTPLVVRGRAVGVMAVLLPNNFVVRTIATSRRTFILIFTVATALTVVVGWVVARRILRPIFELANLAEAVTKGELHRRAEILSYDEIGDLAARFNHMTGWLENSLARVAAENARSLAIVTSIADGVIVYDLDGNQLLTNQAANELLEIHSDEDEMRLKALSLGMSDEPIRLELGEKTLSITAAPVSTDEEGLIGHVLVLRDVTREAIAERTKDSFLDQIGHEFRTPLTAIVGYANILKTGGDRLKPEKRQEAYDSIHDNADRIRLIVDQLIEMTQLHGGDFALQLAPVNLNELVESKLKAWQADFTKARLKPSYGTDAPELEVQVDQKRIGRVLDALFDNAIQFSPGGGKLDVYTTIEYGAARISITDPGVGISGKDLPYVFSRFYRGTPVDADGNLIDVRGMGQGLHMVKIIVEAHGGYIDIDSRVGQGTTVHVYLPLP